VRLFVAVWPSEEVLDAIAALPRPDVPGLRWTTRDQWHVTLRFLGSVDDLDAAVVAVRSIEAPACDVTVGPAVGRFGKRILHVPTHGLDEAAAATVEATADVGEPPEDRAFKGHLTLARSRRGDTDLRPLAGTAISGGWHAGEVTLVRSHLGGSGARYEVIERVPLAAPAT
jgi:RNA 2',3'-cyclic 3'-phosphodiesterase